MANRSASAKIWLGLGTGLVWLSHRRAVNALQVWKARMITQGERFGIDEQPFVAYATKGWHGNFLQRLGKSCLRPPGRTLRNLHAVVPRKGPGGLAAEDFV
jgi:hypothetical protein